MERGMKASPATATATVAVAERYVGWDEVYVCGEKGMREIHYYLKRKDGGSDLAVVGKEKSLRHMTYRFLLDTSPPYTSSSIYKLRSRREVIDWLRSFLPDSAMPLSPQTSGGSMDGSEADEIGLEMMKGYQIHKRGHYSKEFQWLGTPSICRKKRRHYEAFCRNGIKISANEFVYVLAEEGKRLVAYLDDMYEDAKGNKMVVVRWFHEIDEVGIDLPHNFNDREIFFSLCLQDLSIECIDGSAMVLSPEHYTKFLKGVKHTQLKPFVCYRQFDNDELKPLDITQVKGYWKQEIVRYIQSLSSAKTSEKASLPIDSQKKGDISDVSATKPRKRLRLSRDSKVDLQRGTINEMDTDDKCGRSHVIRINQQKNHVTICEIAQIPAAAPSKKDLVMEAMPSCTALGSAVEVLSLDSGMRGCWFRAVVIKKHKNKVKLRYNDVKDAENEANCLEEWVLASRIAARDEMGLRMQGRTTIRPFLLRDHESSRLLNVGAIVDVWWHDGWWEGIVLQKDSDDNFWVYFPGEKREALFSLSDLRPSQEWIGNSWKHFNDRPDLAASILSKLDATKTVSNEQPNPLINVEKHSGHNDTAKDDFSQGASEPSRNLSLESEEKKAKSSPIIDLSKDGFLSQLRWKTSRKRKRLVLQKLPSHGNNSKTSTKRTRSPENRFAVRSTLKVDKETCKSVKVDLENCKYITDSLLTTSVVPPLTSLVMSR